MMIPKGETVELGKRGNFREILKELSNIGFTGYLEVSYKKDELSKAKVLFSNGKIVAAGIQRIISKSEIAGERALEELLSLETALLMFMPLMKERWQRLSSGTGMLWSSI